MNVDGVPVDPEDPEEETVVIGGTEEQTITVSLPMSWQEDGHADVIFSFEFNNQMIPVHYPQENWHSGRHTILLYYPIEPVGIGSNSDVRRLFLLEHRKGLTG